MTCSGYPPYCDYTDLITHCINTMVNIAQCPVKFGYFGMGKIVIPCKLAIPYVKQSDLHGFLSYLKPVELNSNCGLAAQVYPLCFC